MNIEWIEGQLDDPSHFTENIFSILHIHGFHTNDHLLMIHSFNTKLENITILIKTLRKNL